MASLAVPTVYIYTDIDGEVKVLFLRFLKPGLDYHRLPNLPNHLIKNPLFSTPEIAIIREHNPKIATTFKSNVHGYLREIGILYKCPDSRGEYYGGFLYLRDNAKEFRAWVQSGQGTNEGPSTSFGVINRFKNEVLYALHSRLCD